MKGSFMKMTGLLIALCLIIGSFAGCGSPVDSVKESGDTDKTSADTKIYVGLCLIN